MAGYNVQPVYTLADQTQSLMESLLMSRDYCYQCRRAKVTCLCGRIEKQPNEVKIIVLQHPDEVSNAKGSAIIAELGLQQYQCWVGEDFSQHEALTELLTKYPEEVALLYPAGNAIELSDRVEGINAPKLKYLIVIDATWRKAKKIWQLQSQLQKIMTFSLPQEQNSNYRIRKVPKDGYLSTIEGIVSALRLLEGHSRRYQPLLDLFTNMIDFQINKMGKAIYRSNYENKNK